MNPDDINIRYVISAIDRGSRRIASINRQMRDDLRKQNKELEDSNKRAAALDKRFDQLGAQIRDTTRDIDRQITVVRKHNKEIDNSTNSVGKLAQGLVLLRGVWGLVKIPAMISAVGVLTQAIGSLAAGVTALVATMGPLSGVVVAFPALLSAMASGMIAVKLASFDLKKALEGDLEVLKELTPAAREFVRLIGGEGKRALAEFKRAAQDGLFPGVNSGLRSLLGSPTRGAARSGVRGVASAVGGAAARAGAQFASPEWAAGISQMTGQAAQTIERMSTALLNMADGFRYLMGAAGPFLDYFNDLIVRFSEWFELTSKMNAANGDTAKFFASTKQSLSEWGRLIREFGTAMYNVFKAAMPLGRQIVQDLGDGAEAMRLWTESAQGQQSMAKYFQDMKAPLYEVAGFMKDLVASFIRISADQGIVPVLRALRDLLPFIEENIRQTTAAFGPVLVEALRAIVETFTHLAGTSGPLNVFLTALTSMIDAFNELMRSVPFLKEMLITFIGIQAVLKAISVVGLVTGLKSAVALAGQLLATLRGVSVAGGAAAAIGGAAGAGGAAAASRLNPILAILAALWAADSNKDPDRAFGVLPLPKGKPIGEVYDEDIPLWLKNPGEAVYRKWFENDQDKKLRQQQEFIRRQLEAPTSKTPTVDSLAPTLSGSYEFQRTTDEQRAKLEAERLAKVQRILDLNASISNAAPAFAGSYSPTSSPQLIEQIRAGMLEAERKRTEEARKQLALERERTKSIRDRSVPRWANRMKDVLGFLTDEAGGDRARGLSKFTDLYGSKVTALPEGGPQQQMLQRMLGFMRQFGPEGMREFNELIDALNRNTEGRKYDVVGGRVLVGGADPTRGAGREGALDLQAMMAKLLNDPLQIARAQEAHREGKLSPLERRIEQQMRINGDSQRDIRVAMDQLKVAVDKMDLSVAWSLNQQVRVTVNGADRANVDLVSTSTPAERLSNNVPGNQSSLISTESPADRLRTPARGGLRVPGMKTAADTFPAMLSPGEAVITGPGEAMLERLTGMPGILDYIISRQAPHFASGGRMDKKGKKGDKFKRRHRWPQGGLIEGAWQQGYGAGLTLEKERNGILPSIMSTLRAGLRRRTVNDDAGGGGGTAFDKMVAKANEIDGMQLPYSYGGGHGAPNNPTTGITSPSGRNYSKIVGYDCSSAVSNVLYAGGAIGGITDSTNLMGWGLPGPGSKVTVYANRGHTFMTLGGKFFGTHTSNPSGGAGWYSGGSTDGFVARHPQGLRRGGRVGFGYFRRGGKPRWKRDLDTIQAGSGGGLSDLEDLLDSASVDRISQVRNQALQRIEKLRKDGVTKKERAAIARLRGAVSLAEYEGGERVGAIISNVQQGQNAAATGVRMFNAETRQRNAAIIAGGGKVSAVELAQQEVQAQRQAGLGLTNQLGQLQDAMQKAIKTGAPADVINDLKTQIQDTQAKIVENAADVAEAVNRAAEEAKAETERQNAKRLDDLSNNIEDAGHKAALGQIGLQGLELQQRLGKTFDTDAGRAERAAFIRNNIMRDLEAEKAQLQAQKDEADRQAAAATDEETKRRNVELSQSLAEAIAGKQNGLLQAQLEAQELTAKNTEELINEMRQWGGTIGFNFGGQIWNDAINIGTGA